MFNFNQYDSENYTWTTEVQGNKCEILLAKEDEGWQWAFSVNDKFTPDAELDKETKREIFATWMLMLQELKAFATKEGITLVWEAHKGNKAHTAKLLDLYRNGVVHGLFTGVSEVRDNWFVWSADNTTTQEESAPSVNSESTSTEATPMNTTKLFVRSNSASGHFNEQIVWGAKEPAGNLTYGKHIFLVEVEAAASEFVYYDTQVNSIASYGIGSKEVGNDALEEPILGGNVWYSFNSERIVNVQRLDEASEARFNSYLAKARKGDEKARKAHVNLAAQLRKGSCKVKLAVATADVSTTTVTTTTEDTTMTTSNNSAATETNVNVNDAALISTDATATAQNSDTQQGEPAMTATSNNNVIDIKARKEANRARKAARKAAIRAKYAAVYNNKTRHGGGRKKVVIDNSALRASTYAFTVRTSSGKSGKSYRVRTKIAVSRSSVITRHHKIGTKRFTISPRIVTQPEACVNYNPPSLKDMNIPVFSGVTVRPAYTKLCCLIRTPGVGFGSKAVYQQPSAKKENSKAIKVASRRANRTVKVVKATRPTRVNTIVSPDFTAARAAFAAHLARVTSVSAVKASVKGARRHNRNIIRPIMVKGRAWVPGNSLVNEYQAGWVTVERQPINKPVLKSCGAAAAGFTEQQGEQSMPNVFAHLGIPATPVATLDTICAENTGEYVVFVTNVYFNEAGEAIACNNNAPMGNAIDTEGDGSFRLTSGYNILNKALVSDQPIQFTPARGILQNGVEPKYVADKMIKSGKRCVNRKMCSLLWLKRDGAWDYEWTYNFGTNNVFIHFDSKLMGESDYGAKSELGTLAVINRNEIRDTLLNGGKWSNEDHTVVSNGLLAACGTNKRVSLVVIARFAGFSDVKSDSRYRDAEGNQRTAIRIDTNKMAIGILDGDNWFGPRQDYTSWRSSNLKGSPSVHANEVCAINLQMFDENLNSSDSNVEPQQEVIVEPVVEPAVEVIEEVKQPAVATQVEIVEDTQVNVLNNDMLAQIQAYHEMCKPKAWAGVEVHNFGVEDLQAALGGLYHSSIVKGKIAPWMILGYIYARSGGCKLTKPATNFSFVTAPAISADRKVSYNPVYLPGHNVLSILGREIKVSKGGAPIEDLNSIESGVVYVNNVAKAADFIAVVEGSVDMYALAKAGVDTSKLWVIPQNWYEYRHVSYTVEDLRVIFAFIKKYALIKDINWVDNVDGSVRINFGSEGKIVDYLDIVEGVVKDSRGRAFTNAFIVNPWEDCESLTGTALFPRNSVTALVQKIVDAFCPRLAGMGNATSGEGYKRITPDLFVSIVREDDYAPQTTDEYEQLNSGVVYTIERTWDVLFTSPRNIFTGKPGSGIVEIKGFDKSKGVAGLTAFNRANSYVWAEKVFTTLMNDYGMGVNPKKGAKVVNGDLLHINWHYLPSSYFRTAMEFLFSTTDHNVLKAKLVEKTNELNNVVDASEEEFWSAAARVFTTTQTTKPAKAAKRVMLALASAVEIVDGVKAGWKLAGMRDQLSVNTYETLIAGSFGWSPGINLLVKDANGNVKRPTGVVSHRAAIEFKPAAKHLKDKFTYTGEIAEEFTADWVTEVIVDGEWHIAKCELDVKSDTIIGMSGQNTITACQEGVLIEVKWRQASTVMGVAIHVEWVVNTYEQTHKGRGVNKSMYVTAPHNIVYNSMNKEVGNVEMIMTSDCLKADVVYSMLMIIGSTFCYSNNEEYKAMIAAVNELTEGRAHSEYLYIEPVFVLMGKYQALIDRFVADFGKAMWFFMDGSGDDIAWMRREFIKREHSEGVKTWTECVTPGEAAAFAVENGYTTEAFVQLDNKVDNLDKQNILVFFYQDGQLVSYAQRTWVFGTVRNPELFEHSTVQQSVSISEQMGQNIRALSRVIGYSDELLAEQKDMVNAGDVKRAQFALLALMNKEYNFAEQAGFNTIDLRTVAGIKEFRAVCKGIATKLIGSTAMTAKEYNEFHKGLFLEFTKLFNKTVLIIGKDKSVMPYWLPLLASYNSNKTTGMDDSSASSILREMFVYILTSNMAADVVANQANFEYGIKANGKVKKLFESKTARSLTTGREGSHAKRVTIPGLDINEIAFIVSTGEDTPYANLRKICANNKIRFYQGMPGNFVRMPIAEGPVLKAYFYNVEGDDLVARNKANEEIRRIKGWAFSEVTFAINPLTVIVDEGDFDGDSSIFFPIKDNKLGKKTLSRAQMLEFVTKRFGYNPLDIHVKDENGNVIGEVESYYRDHYAIHKHSKLLGKVNIETPVKALAPWNSSIVNGKSIEGYIDGSYKSYDLQTKAVGKSYDVWNFAEGLLDVSNSMTAVRELYSWTNDNSIVGRATEPYETFLGGYSKEAYDVWVEMSEMMSAKDDEAQLSMKLETFTKAIINGGLNPNQEAIANLAKACAFNGSMMAIHNGEASINTLNPEVRKYLAAIEFVYMVGRGTKFQFPGLEKIKGNIGLGDISMYDKSDYSEDYLDLSGMYEEESSKGSKEVQKVNHQLAVELCKTITDEEAANSIVLYTARRLALQIGAVVLGTPEKLSTDNFAKYINVVAGKAKVNMNEPELIEEENEEDMAKELSISELNIIGYNDEDECAFEDYSQELEYMYADEDAADAYEAERYYNLSYAGESEEDVMEGRAPFGFNKPEVTEDEYYQQRYNEVVDINPEMASTSPIAEEDVMEERAPFGNFKVQSQPETVVKEIQPEAVVEVTVEETTDDVMEGRAPFGNFKSNDELEAEIEAMLALAEAEELKAAELEAAVKKAEAEAKRRQELMVKKAEAEARLNAAKARQTKAIERLNELEPKVEVIVPKPIVEQTVGELKEASTETGVVGRKTRARLRKIENGGVAQNESQQTKTASGNQQLRPNIQVNYTAVNTEDVMEGRGGFGKFANNNVVS